MDKSFSAIIRKLLISSVFGLLLAVSLTSCGLISASNSAESETSGFRKGELQAELNASLQDTWQAVQSVAENSKFQIKSSRSDAFTAVLKADDAQQRKIETILERIHDKRTRVRIRIGLLGDAELSNQIFDKIRSEIRNK